MPLSIYNSLTRKKEEFVPLVPGQVNMYTCGVTVYDECHIGHARSLYIFDVIRRYLKYRGFDVKFVRNITDIDDKIINRANELKTDWKELVKKYIGSYYGDLAVLRIDKADDEPRATENIEEMKKHIQGLIEKGYAYQAQAGVYFSVRKFKDYGKLSGQSIDQMLSGVRKEADETKEDPLDFALWKKSKPGEPSWGSPWGEGRPGWHIECSVMSAKYLKTNTLDIHAGGRDLIFPHHENEIAQSEALTGKPFAKYWIHHGLLTINGQKMAKSLGNFITIKEVLSKYPADVLKIFYLQAHYSSPIDFSWEKMEEAKQALERITILLGKIEASASSSKPQETGGMAQELENIQNKFIAAMDDDFNTPQAIAVLFDVSKEVNSAREAGALDSAGLQSIDEFFVELGGTILGIIPTEIERSPAGEERLDVDLIQLLIDLRMEVRTQKLWSLADTIRQRLSDLGVVLEDKRDGTSWRRV